MADYYNTLKIKKNATDAEIRQAFRKLARQYHPDLNPGDDDAETRFKSINEAYEVLSKPDSRRKYDRYGDNWKNADRIEEQRKRYGGSPFGTFTSGRGRRTSQASDPFANLEDLVGNIGGSSFGGFRGSGSRSISTETAVAVSLEDAFNGTSVTATLNVRGRERRFEVNIPPGVDTGSVVRISPDSGTRLRFNLTIEPHETFKRTGNDLQTDVDIPFEDAILGGEAEITTIEGKQVWVKIPAESQNGQRIRFRGQGMPKLNNPEDRGDLYVTVRPSLPTNLNEDELAVIREYKEMRATDAELTP
ncbi:MAG: J domain-containing protein [Dehalococcoidia bacterium]|nr:J domain-containing protein [Dehalococcoidia bacterium]